jgi:hypothetical protein
MERYALCLALADAEPMADAMAPAQDAHLAIRLRNWLTHCRPEDGGEGTRSGLGDGLAGRFPGSPR